MNKDGSTIAITCPLMIQDYNRHMGYVDKADALKSYYELKRRSKKWWPRIFYHFLDVAVVNAFILYKMNSENSDAGKVMNLKMFKMSVAAGLVGDIGKSTPTGRKRKSTTQSKYKISVPLETRFTGLHFPEKGPRRRCSYCSTKIEPHVSRWFCKTCNVGLCLEGKECFKNFHTK